MKKKLFHFLSFAMILSCAKLNAQTTSKQEVPQHPIPKRASSIHQKKSINSPNPYPTMKIDENDQYMGREKEFLSIMTVTSMPSDFPKYNRSLGLAGYNNTIEYYFKQNQSLLKDKYRQKLTKN